MQCKENNGNVLTIEVISIAMLIAIEVDLCVRLSARAYFIECQRRDMRPDAKCLVHNATHFVLRHMLRIGWIPMNAA